MITEPIGILMAQSNVLDPCYESANTTQSVIINDQLPRLQRFCILLALSRAYVHITTAFLEQNYVLPREQPSCLCYIIHNC